MTMKNGLARIALLAVAASLALTAQAQTKVKRGWNLFGKDQDVEIGAQSSQEVEKQLPVLQDAEVQAYVQNLGARLAAQAPGTKFPYTFKVLDIAEINAFALPGGPIYVHRGTIEAARNEGELAGVIAHEISHVSLRHGTSQASKMLATQLGTQLVLGLALERSGSGADTRKLVEQVGGFGLNLTFLKYSRTAESDADILGTQTLARAGYDPVDMANFFDTLAKDSPSRSADFLSDHPAPTRRKERVQDEAKSLTIASTPHSEQQFQAVRARLARMPPARTMKEIKAAGGGTTTTSSGGGSGLPDKPPASVDPPSRQLTWHRSASNIYEVAHPTNWSVISEQGSSLTLAAPGGAWRSSSGTDVRFGALLGIAAARQTVARENVADASEAFVDSLMSANPHLRLISGSRRTRTIDGGPGQSVQLEGRSPSTKEDERVAVVTRLLSDGRLLHMVFVTPENAPRVYDDLLEAMTKNLRVVDNRLK